MTRLLLAFFFPVLLAAQTPSVPPPHPKLPPPEGGGFRVLIIPDMEGMGSAVDIHEVIAGNEGEQYRTLTSDDYWQRFRGLLTQEVNAAIAGARSAGARSFVVNEGHGGNLFANVLPWDLDTAAILVRGFPKPLVMITGIDSTVGTLMFTGAHAGAGSPGVLAHNFAFDAFTVNGTKLNEVGINALIAAEYGVAVSLVSGDDVLIRETREILGNDFVGIVTKYAVGRMAAITFSPARVRRMLQDSAAVAVRRAIGGGGRRVQALPPGEAVSRGVHAAPLVSGNDRPRGGLAALARARKDRRAIVPPGHIGRAPHGVPARCDRAGSTALSPRAWLLCAALVPTALAAQQPQQAPPQPPPRDSTPPEAYYGVTEWREARAKLEPLMDRRGFTVYIIGDMEGLAAAVRNATEMRPPWRGGGQDHERFRVELTDEVNAVIAGAREAGATQFVVNDGHGGTLFRNTLPDRLDPEAILIRGYPKPIVMSTGLNPEVDVIFIVGAHANAGTPGIISHSFAFDSFTVNGRVLNEAGIAAFIGGEMGVPLALASGDQVLTAETRDMLGPIETVTTKLAMSRSAGAGYAPAHVHAELKAAAGRAVRRVKAGELKALRLSRPYQVRFCMRASYDPWFVGQVRALKGLRQDGGQRCFAYTSQSAEEVGDLLNRIEWIVLKP